MPATRQELQERLEAGVKKLSISDLKKLVMDDTTPDPLHDAALDRLQAIMPEDEFVSFCDSY